jgi:hypothetical protein
MHAINSVPPHQRGGRDNRAICHKPRGFWVSDDADECNWRSWCESEEFGCGPKFAHEIYLHPSARILIIGTNEEFDAFNAEYGVRDISEYIAWDRVCAEYQGIIITPYLYERRFGPLWYYTWDCASGCIWDADAIAGWSTLIPVEFGQRQSDAA